MPERYVYLLRPGRRAVGDSKLVVFAHAHTHTVTVAKWYAHTHTDYRYRRLAADATALFRDMKDGFAVDVAVSQGRCGVIQVVPVVLQPDLRREPACADQRDKLCQVRAH